MTNLPPAPPLSTLTPQNGQIISTLNRMQGEWCLYEVYDADRVLIYIGVCRLLEIYSMPDARQNSEFAKIVQPNEVMTLCIVATSERMHECMNARHTRVASLRPRCNIHGVMVSPARLPIFCIETGERFETLQACATAHGIHASALSMHLNRKAGHKSVGGHTYRRGNAP